MKPRQLSLGLFALLYGFVEMSVLAGCSGDSGDPTSVNAQTNLSEAAVLAKAAPMYHPEWTLKTTKNELDERVATLEVAIPGSLRDYGDLWLNFQIGAQCEHVVHCSQTTCGFNCPAGITCNWDGLSFLWSAGERTFSQRGSGYELRGEAKGRKILIALELYGDFYLVTGPCANGSGRTCSSNFLQFNVTNHGNLNMGGWTEFI